MSSRYVRQLATMWEQLRSSKIFPNWRTLPQLRKHARRKSNKPKFNRIRRTTKQLGDSKQTRWKDSRSQKRDSKLDKSRKQTHAETQKSRNFEKTLKLTKTDKKLKFCVPMEALNLMSCYMSCEWFLSGWTSAGVEISKIIDRNVNFPQITKFG